MTIEHLDTPQWRGRSFFDSQINRAKEPGGKLLSQQFFVDGNQHSQLREDVRG